MRPKRIAWFILPVLLLSACGTPEKAPPSVGDSQQVDGTGQALLVTLQEKIDPLPAPKEGQAAPGRRLVGFRLKVKNLSGHKAKFLPLGDVRLKTSSGFAPVTIVNSPACPAKQQATTRIDIQATQDLCTVFQPKQQARLSELQVYLPGGGPDGVRSWQLGRQGK